MNGYAFKKRNFALFILVSSVKRCQLLKKVFSPIEQTFPFNRDPVLEGVCLGKQIGRQK